MILIDLGGELHAKSRQVSDVLSLFFTKSSPKEKKQKKKFPPYSQCTCTPLLCSFNFASSFKMNQLHDSDLWRCFSLALLPVWEPSPLLYGWGDLLGLAVNYFLWGRCIYISTYPFCGQTLSQIHRCLTAIEIKALT